MALAAWIAVPETKKDPATHSTRYTGTHRLMADRPSVPIRCPTRIPSTKILMFSLRIDRTQGRRAR